MPVSSLTRSYSATRRVFIVVFIVMVVHGVLAAGLYRCAVAHAKPENSVVISMLIPETLPIRAVEPAKLKVKSPVAKPELEPAPALKPMTKVAEARPVNTPEPTAQAAPVPVTEVPSSAPLPEPTAPSFNVEGLQNPEPSYPALSRRMGEAGKVTLRVLVSVDGLAGEVQLAKSTGFSRLDQAALATVKKWHFKPAQLGNDKVAAWVLVPIIFTLENE